MKITEGFVDAHSHLRATSLADHDIYGSCLEEILLRMNAMTAIDVTDDAFVAASELLLSGVTGVQLIFHRFGTPDEYFTTLGKVILGLRSTKIRFKIVLGVTDQYEFLPQESQSYLGLPAFIDTGPRMQPQDFYNLVIKIQSAFPDIEFAIGPIAPQWCSDAMMQVISDFAHNGISVHTHFLESRLQRNWIAEGPFERLQRFNLLGPRTSLAHAVWLSDRELAEIKLTGTQLVTCPRSNVQLKAGSADIPQWISHEVDFGIGLDSIYAKDSPYAVARMVLDDAQSIKALTQSGQKVTGLDTNLDQVHWANLEEGIASEVSINGEKIISNQSLSNHDLFEAARARIAEALVLDSKFRRIKHQELSRIMPEYLREITDS